MNTSSSRQTALVVALNDAKLDATSRDWLPRSISLTQQLRDAGFDAEADAMRRTESLDEFLQLCRTTARNLYTR